MNKTISSCILKGEVSAPASKSDGQRVILAAGLSTGTTRVIGVGKSDDERAMLQNIEELGADVQLQEDGSYLIRGIQSFPVEAELNAGESGLGMRLITGVCAGHEGHFFITGEGSLLKRPQLFFEQHLTQMGVRVSSNDGYLPITVDGRMHGGIVEIDGSASSQFLSGMLMSLPLIEEDSTLVVHNLKSIPYVQMTLDTLKSFGVHIENENFERFFIKGNQSYTCDSYIVEGDWSSVSYWLVAAALGHPICVSGLYFQSAQADTALLKILEAANCEVAISDTTVEVKGENRLAFHADATHCPDLFPALVVLAAFCEGRSTISGLHRLKIKESDRGTVLQQEFAKFGLKIELDEANDVMMIHGGTTLHAARVDSHNDHRIAMCLAIAASKIEGESVIAGAEAVSKSYPDFWEDFDRLNG
ncbi:MAG: 3-phosphoshikimate 1-carboxyvinyltransferase [Flavobacteriales bacterium]|nr:3-phosphoshikimate 1-carboxyvinyltransferase [Flavobacteriales bacterium]